MDSPTAHAAFDIPAFLQTERRRVEAALGRALGALLPLAPVLTRDAIRQGVTTGGKRLRPILCMAAYEALGGSPRHGIEELAVSLELIHAYSLMHDDLPCMDDAPLRRGSPTPHMVYGEPAVVLGGAALISLAHLHLWRTSGAMGLSDPVRRELLRVLARAAGAEGMVGGQALDLWGEGRSLGRQELDELHRRKTGALLTASLELGAVAALPALDHPAREAMVAYGGAIGLAFQIADDVLDATADAEALGKAPSDAALDKSTYVALLGVEGARKAAGHQVAEARAALAGAGIEAPALEALADYVVTRDR
ncbi:MAG: polyprenyl synthetase family protein [Gemmatimonadales bacterium]|nr:MAG: polyprenyl synthetase family protein [Gemmatimonadales bacterium]